MQNWIVETLTLVRRHAAESGLENLTEEMDIALLVAAEEFERRNWTVKGRVNVGEITKNSGEVVVYPRAFGIRRYH